MNNNTMHTSVDLIDTIKNSNFHPGIKSFLTKAVLAANKLQGKIDSMSFSGYTKGDANAEKDRIVSDLNNDFFDAFEKHK